MAALPYIQLYVADYLADTAHLTAAQHGGYLLLLFNYWQRGKPLDNRNERLANVARMSNEEWQQNRDSIAEFFDIDGDIWTHRRVDADLSAVGAKSTKNSDAGKASAAAKKEKKERSLNECSTAVERTFNQAEADTEADIKPKPQAAALAQPAPEESPPAAAALAFADPIVGRAIELTALLAKRGAALQASDPRVRAWAESGVTDTQALQAMDVANERRQEKADPRPINAGFLDAILGDITNSPPANARASPGRMSHADQSRLAASRAIFGTEIEGKNNEYGRRIIDVTPTAPLALGG